MSVAATDQATPDPVAADRQQFLVLLGQIPDQRVPQATPILFEALAAWWRERGPSIELLDAICDKLGLDRAVGGLYMRCPELIPVMERLRQGEKVHNVKVSLALSREGRRWWHSLLIVGVLQRRGGVVDHVRLVRHLAHRAVAQEIRQALAYLKDTGLVEEFHRLGKDPSRPTTWYRLTADAASATSLHPSTDFLANTQPGPLALALWRRAR